MGLVERQKRAIARIAVVDAGAEVSRGTGFLVARGAPVARVGAQPSLVAGGAAGPQGEQVDLVLTAAHVVFDPATQAPRPGTIALRFGTDTGAPQDVAAEITSRFDLGRDWALLACKAPVQAAPLGPFARAPDGGGIVWSSFGYTEARPISGAPYDGTVAGRGADILHLSSPELAGAGGGDPRGLSGAPCVSEGHVVGIVRAAPTGAAPPPAGVVAYEGRVWALPIERVVEACPEVMALSEALPFERAFASSLRQRARDDPDGAEALATMLVQAEPVPPQAEQPRWIARRLVARGFGTIVEALGAYQDFFGDRMGWFLERAESLWIDARAAEQLAELLDTEGRPPAAINTSHADTARQYLLRASDAKAKGALWADNAVPVGPVIEEGGYEDALVAAVEDALRRKLGCMRAAAGELKKRLAARTLPIVVLVHESAPWQRTIDALTMPRLAELPRVRFVLLTGTALAPSASSARARLACIEPDIVPPTEEEAFEKSHEARVALGLVPVETSP